MSSVTDSVGSLFGSESDGARAARHGMERNMSYQDKGLQYLLDADQLPQELKQNALGQLGGLYGVNDNMSMGSPELIREMGFDSNTHDRLVGDINFRRALNKLLRGENNEGSVDSFINQFDPETIKQLNNNTGARDIIEDAMRGKYSSQNNVQQGMIDQARQSPLYGAIMGGQREGNDVIRRNASMSGGMRSGNLQHNFMDFNTDLSNKALLDSYNQQLMGLQGMANQPTGEAGIANQYNLMGGTIGQGTVDQQYQQGLAQQQGMGFIRQGVGMAAGGMSGGMGGGSGMQGFGNLLGNMGF